MAFSYDTGASPSRRSRQTWPALFVATSTSLQSAGGVLNGLYMSG